MPNQQLQPTLERNAGAQQARHGILRLLRAGKPCRGAAELRR